MTDKYAELRAALAAGPTPGPWLLDKFHPIITDSAPGSSRVWICKVAINTRNDEGRKNEAYIAAANPETIRALLAERDSLREALQKVRPVIAADRQSLLETHGDGSEIPAADELGTLGLYEYDGALHVIDAALAQHQGEKHGN